MKILDLIFPQTIKCFVCKRELEKFGVCNECYPNLPWVKGKTCEVCGGGILGDGIICDECKNGKYYFKKNFSIFEYAGDIQKNILSFKNGNKYLGDYFGEFIRDYIKKNNLNFDIIIPIPIHTNRRKSRGFNQSEVLINSLKDEYTVEDKCVVRIKDTPHQTGLNKEHRQINLKNAFEVVEKDKIKDKVILLIDDIYTTGSTLNECARTLKKNGAKTVYGLCLARATFDKLKGD